MDHNEKNQDFTLEDILQEFHSDVPETEEIALLDSEFPEIPQEETAGVFMPEPLPEADSVMTADTIRLEELPLNPRDPDAEEAPVPTGETQVLPPLFPEEPAQEPVPEAEAAPEPPVEKFEFSPDPAPIPKPIQFRSRLSELKRQLVAGPEKRYYDLTEIGLGRVQLAIFLNLIIVALCCGGTALFAMGMVAQNRLRLMIFSQILALMLSALLGCYTLMDGILDLFTGRFSLNSMLFLTLAACAADAVFCLQELRVPCCAAFSLEMACALWNRSLRRSTEMGQMDTLRKASRLDSVIKVPDQLGSGPAIVRTEGRLEDFMDHYAKRSGPERTLNIYALLSVLACIGIAALAGLRHNLSMAVQVFATSMLAAVPAGAFISQSRPAAILERRLHMVGAVLCGWKGIKSLCGKAAFPLDDKDLFPLGTVKLNGVKVLGNQEPEAVIEAAAALTGCRGGGLEPVFTQLLKSRGGFACDVEEFRILNGGLAGIVNGESCLLGLHGCLQEQGVEIPEAAQVENALYFAVDGVLTAVFVLSYNRTKSSAAGLVAIQSRRKLRPLILCRNFMITPQLIREKFNVRTKRFEFPEPDVRDALAAFTPEPELLAGALTTQQHLSATAYAVTGARTLRGTCRTGAALHIFAGMLGLLIMAVLAYLGDLRLLSPLNVLLYQLVWMIPGLLVTAWARVV